RKTTRNLRIGNPRTLSLAPARVSAGWSGRLAHTPSAPVGKTRWERYSTRSWTPSGSERFDTAGEVARSRPPGPVHSHNDRCDRAGQRGINMAARPSLAD